MIELPVEFRDYVRGISRRNPQDKLQWPDMYHQELFRMKDYIVNGCGIGILNQKPIGLIGDKVYVPRARVFIEFLTENANLGAKPIEGRFFLENLLSQNFSNKLPTHLVDYVNKIAIKTIQTTFEGNKELKDLTPVYKNLIEELGHLKRQAITYHRDLGKNFVLRWREDLTNRIE